MAFDVEMPTITSGILFNITMQVEEQFLDEWLTWIQHEHIPATMGTGCFIKHQVLRLMIEDDLAEPTYAIQYFASSIYKFKQFDSVFREQLLKNISDKWDKQVMFFTTTMEIVN